MAKQEEKPQTKDEIRAEVINELIEKFKDSKIHSEDTSLGININVGIDTCIKTLQSMLPKPTIEQLAEERVSEIMEDRFSSLNYMTGGNDIVMNVPSFKKILKEALLTDLKK